MPTSGFQRKTLPDVVVFVNVLVIVVGDEFEAERLPVDGKRGRDEKQRDTDCVAGFSSTIVRRPAAVSGKLSGKRSAGSTTVAVLTLAGMSAAVMLRFENFALFDFLRLSPYTDPDSRTCLPTLYLTAKSAKRDRFSGRHPLRPQRFKQVDRAQHPAPVIVKLYDAHRHQPHCHYAGYAISCERHIALDR